MKRILIISGILLLGCGASAQLKLGLKVSPNFSWNRVIVPEGNEISGKGLAMRFGGGAFLDFEFADNYAASTGISYTTKGAGIKGNTVDTTGKTAEYTSKVSLQYVEIPVALKLFTNEIGTDMRLYFQVGTTININLAAKVDGEKSYTDGDGQAVDYAKQFNPIDFSVLASSGVEMQMGDNTAFFGGISYNRGLLNIVKKDYRPVDGFEMYNEYVSLDVGLKF